MSTEKHFQSSDLLRDIVIGVSDGLTVPFALAAGLSGAVSQVNIVITAGVAEIVAGSIAMGLGGYLAGNTEVQHYEAEVQREYYEVENHYDIEIQETKDAFASYGLSDELQTTIAHEIARDKDKWVEFMMRYELGLEKPDANRARKSAFNIGLSYVVGGFIPLSAYFFSDTVEKGFFFSSIITVLCLFIFGYFKSRAIGQPPVPGALKVTLVGAVAAAAAYSIARLVGA